MNEHSFKGIILTTLGAACWGLSGSMGQYLFEVQNMDSRWLVPIRLGVAGILILIYSFLKYKKETLKPWASKEKAITMVIYGLAGVSLCQFLYFLTIQLSNAAMGTILQDLAPAMILACACIAQKRKPKPIEIIAIAMALIGVFFIATHGDINTLVLPFSALLAGIGSAVCVTIYNVIAPKLTSELPVIIIQGWSFLMGGLVASLVFQIWTISYRPNLYGILGIIFVIVIGNICAFTLYISGVSIVGPSRASLYSFAEPITAAIISTTILGSKFTIYDGIGFVLIFAMLYLITFAKRT